MRLETAVDQYLDDSDHQGLLRALTVEKYRYVLTIFVAFMAAKHPDVELEDVRLVHLNEFVTATAKERGHSKTTVEHYVSTLRSLFNHFLYLELLPDNPAIRLRRPRRDKRVPDILTMEEVWRLFAADLRPKGSRFRRDGFDYDRRNQLIVRLFLTSAIRRAELCALNWGHLDLAARTLTVRAGKGGKDRVVPLVPWMAQELAQYRADRGAGYHDPVFTNAQGERLGPEAITALFQRLVSPAVGRRVTPHTLRATCATMMLNHEAGILNVQQVLGHDRLESTQFYLKPDWEQVVAAMEKHPLANRAWQLSLPLGL